MGQNVYGVLLIDNSHCDVSLTLKGAKQYATRNGFDVVTIRYNCGYIANCIAKKVNGKWVNIN